MDKSRAEEIICVLFIISGFTAEIAGYPMVATGLFVKAGVDFICVIVVTRRELKEEAKP